MRGSAALFALGLGMGLPLLAFGTFGATALPKSGAWLVRVKQTFGMVSIGVAIWMTSRILPLPSIAITWGAFAVGIALWLGWSKLQLPMQSACRGRQAFSSVPTRLTRR